MAKTDVKSAFRIIPIQPADYSLLGTCLKWENLYYFDRTLPMGLTSSCAIFEAVSTALEWISIHHLGAKSVLHIHRFSLHCADQRPMHTRLVEFCFFVRIYWRSSRPRENSRSRFSFAVCRNNFRLRSHGSVTSR
ncbi:unnamed protein product [Pocillopora meandrina]|uniref:Uncharacterized protein n=1 Tax=Pocillopora meandrina TaxID=46732 RepID=A0AAU9X077_9CNID|nr:unnamed protein product [Pocillopora meandrina]